MYLHILYKIRLGGIEVITKDTLTHRKINNTLLAIIINTFSVSLLKVFYLIFYFRLWRKFYIYKVLLLLLSLVKEIINKNKKGDS